MEPWTQVLEENRKGVAKNVTEQYTAFENGKLELECERNQSTKIRWKGLLSARRYKFSSPRSQKWIAYSNDFVFTLLVEGRLIDALRLGYDSGNARERTPLSNIVGEGIDNNIHLGRMD